jgi:tRNA(adenine34) deaminase
MEANHQYFMKQALKEAHRAFEEDEVPVGAVIVMQNKIIARGYNQVEKLNDSTAHAEMIALTSAFNFLGSKYVTGADLYVTIEPCLMCAGALYWSKISRVIYGAKDEKHGGQLLAFSDSESSITTLQPKTEIISGICKDECIDLMKEFFQARR